MPEVT